MAAMITISAQRFLDDDIVEQKRAARDFSVMVSPAFEIDGQMFRVVVDGHHSLAAARAAGVDVDFCEQSARDNDTIGLIVAGRVDDFLAIHRIDSDYYDIETGRDIW